MGNNFFTGASDLSEPNDFVERLRDLTRDLVFISETDAPLKPFRIAVQNTPDLETDLVAFASIPAAAHREKASAADLFARLTRKYDGANEASIRIAERFVDVYGFLKSELTDLTVLRFGTIRIRVFVVGRLRDGTIAGFETEAVET